MDTLAGAGAESGAGRRTDGQEIEVQEDSPASSAQTARSIDALYVAPESGAQSPQTPAVMAPATAYLATVAKVVLTGAACTALIAVAGMKRDELGQAVAQAYEATTQAVQRVADSASQPASDEANAKPELSFDKKNEALPVTPHDKAAVASQTARDAAHNGAPETAELIEVAESALQEAQNAPGDEIDRWRETFAENNIDIAKEDYAENSALEERLPADLPEREPEPGITGSIGKWMEDLLSRYW